MDFHTTPDGYPDGYPGELPPRELRLTTTALLKDTEFLKQYKERVAAAPKDAQNRRDRISVAMRDRGRKIGMAADREQIRRVLDDVLALPEPTRNRLSGDRTLRFMQDPVAWEDETPKVKPRPEADPAALLAELINVPRQVTDGFAARANRTALPGLSDQVDRRWIAEAWLGAFLNPSTNTFDTTLPKKLHFHDETIHLTQPKKETTMHTTPITVTTKTFTYVNGTDINNFRPADLYDLIASEEDQIRKLEAIENKPLTLQQEITRRRQGIADLVAHLDSQVPADQAATAA